MPGGLGCVLDDAAQDWPTSGQVRAKDVWILAEDPAAIAGPPSNRTPPLAIRRPAGDMGFILEASPHIINKSYYTLLFYKCQMIYKFQVFHMV